MGVQAGGGLLLFMVLFGLVPAAFAGWLAIGGLVTLSFGNQLVDLGEKIVKKAYGKASAFNKWLDYRADFREFKRTQKDVWANPTKVHKKAIKPRIDKEKKAQASMKHFDPLQNNKFRKFSKKKTLGKAPVNEIDLSAGL